MKKLLIIVFILVIIVVGAVFYFQQQLFPQKSNKVLDDLTTTNQQLLEANQENETLKNQIKLADNKSSSKIPYVYTYKSPNLKYILYLYSDTNSADGPCVSELRDGQGGGSSALNDAIKGIDFGCYHEMSFKSNFVGWSIDNKIIVKENEGSVAIIDVVKKETSRYTYDPQKYSFMGVNKALKYWLFKKITVVDKISYILLDSNQKVVKDNIDFTANDRGVQYDYVNDGFLFINRTFKGPDVFVTFSFLSLKDLKIKNILTTEPIEAPGRGCNSEYLISQAGEVILTQGCLTVGEKYLGVDGSIHIKL